MLRVVLFGTAAIHCAGTASAQETAECQLNGAVQNCALDGPLQVDGSITVNQPSGDAESGGTAGVKVTTGSHVKDVGIEVQMPEGAMSGIDIHKQSYQGRFLGFANPDGKIVSQFGTSGQFETVAWTTITGVIRDEGDTRYFVHPTDRPYMLGVWSDVFGPTAVFRANMYGSEDEAWPVSIISGSGRETLRITGGGDILMGDIAADPHIPGERMSLRLTRHGQVGFQAKSMSADHGPAYFAAELDGYYAGTAADGTIRPLLRFAGGTSVLVGTGSDDLVLSAGAGSILFEGNTRFRSVTAEDLATMAPIAGALTFCGDCEGGAFVFGNGSSWRPLGGDSDLGTEAGGGFGSAYVAVNGSGALPSASAPQTVAIGSGSRATGAGSISIGDGSSATAAGAVALGQDSIATNGHSMALGFKSAATGYNSMAIGPTAAATGSQSMATGIFARAYGDSATALGYAASSYGDDATTIGSRASAAGGGATAIGAGASTGGTQATAVGAGASAGHAGSTAVGANATTTGENQVVLGGAGSSVKLGDVEASTAAQVGPVWVVTTDENGTLGRQAAASTQSVGRVSMDLLQAVQITDARFDALDGRVAVLEGSIAEVARESSGGIAAAMALAGTTIVPDSNLSVSFNLSTYQGKQGFSATVAGRIVERVYVTGGVAGSTVRGTTGGRVGLTFGM